LTSAALAAAARAAAALAAAAVAALFFVVDEAVAERAAADRAADAFAAADFAAVDFAAVDFAADVFVPADFADPAFAAAVRAAAELAGFFGVAVVFLAAAAFTAAASVADRGVRPGSALTEGLPAAVLWLLGDSGAAEVVSSTWSALSSGEGVTVIRYQRDQIFSGSKKQLTENSTIETHPVSPVCTRSRKGNGSRLSRGFPGGLASMILGTKKCPAGEPAMNTLSF
jgi:hypothetical protein